RVLFRRADEELARQLVEAVDHAGARELPLEPPLEALAGEDARGREAEERRERAAPPSHDLPRELRRAAAELADVGVEEIGAGHGLDPRALPPEPSLDLLGADAVGEQAPDDRAGADPADDVGVCQAERGQELLERAEHAELVEQALRAAAREAERDLA